MLHKGTGSKSARCYMIGGMSPKGPYPKGVAKREEILRTALEIFSREGYRGTSLREVARSCGLSLPGLMHYFDSKEDLLAAILKKRDEDDFARAACSRRRSVHDAQRRHAAQRRGARAGPAPRDALRRGQRPRPSRP